MTNKKIYSPHDKMFKQALADKEVAFDFFQKHLPTAIKEKVDFSSLEFCKETFLEDFKTSAADVLYRLRINQKPGYIYTLCEHQSTVDKMLAFRLLCYVIQVMKMHLEQTGATELPIVYCVVFYTGKEPYTATLDIFDLFGENKELAAAFLFKPYQLIDVNQIDDMQLRKALLAGLFEFVMKHVYLRDFFQIAEIIIKWASEIESKRQSGFQYLRNVLEYVIDQANIDHEQFAKLARQYLSPKLESEVMTIAQQLRQEGRQAAVHEVNTIAQQLRQEGRQPALHEINTMSQQLRQEGRQQG